jgi:hypothetical protein
VARDFLKGERGAAYRHPPVREGFAFLTAAMLAGLTAACLPAPPATTSPTVPPAPTLTASVAFPTLIPTTTWTPAPSLTPTADVRGGIGPVVLFDTFDEAGPWELSTSATGASEINLGKLTLAVRAPRAYQDAQREAPSMADFYAEVEVHTQLCNPGDEFGLTARGNALGEHYRFLIGCDGSARITRFLQDGSRALTLRVETPAIIAGAPAVNRLAVWAMGLDLKLFVNGDEVVAARDAALDRGTFGVIARAGSSGQVAVSFDNLVVRALSDALATASAAATAPP